jgi:hypothetical protein
MFRLARPGDPTGCHSVIAHEYKRKTNIRNAVFSIRNTQTKDKSKMAFPRCKHSTRSVRVLTMERRPQRR